MLSRRNGISNLLRSDPCDKGGKRKWGPFCVQESTFYTAEKKGVPSLRGGEGEGKAMGEKRSWGGERKRSGRSNILRGKVWEKKATRPGKERLKGRILKKRKKVFL